jgi:hypothetical protein
MLPGSRMKLQDDIRITTLSLKKSIQRTRHRRNANCSFGNMIEEKMSPGI